MTSTTATEKKGPNYVYKLVPPSIPVPDPLPEKLDVSELDKSSGFIHLSTSVQVPGTLKHFFADQPRVSILRVPLAPVEKVIKWEDPKAEVCGPRGGEGMFPHLYNDGLKLGKDEVESVRVLENSGGWDTALKGVEEWLVY
jgi:uncharacterized protein (DUF952 family)